MKTTTSLSRRLFGVAVICMGMLGAGLARAADEFKASWVTASDGVRLSVREYGNLQGPAIVFVHGIAQSQLSFDRQVHSELAKKYHLVTYDLRGHGESDKPTSEEAYVNGRRMSDDLRSVMTATGVHKPVLVGWSLGGIIVAQYLSDYGDAEISGVNFVGARIAQPPGTPARMPGAAYIRTMLSPKLEENIRATASFVRACVATPLSPADFELMLGYNMASPVFARAATLKWSGGTDFAAALPRTKVPVLISHGRLDQVISPDVAQEAGRILPAAKVSWYDHGGHSLFFDDAPRFNAELAAFVDAATAMTH
ncbi:alpha/beta fold hydrolase [Variovorax sp. PBL-E5]|uniref:alpha/beta fold hydrolase n=1 Tax=Variovorax sp. PBL-E5 TaxID=434014 RepID=UPI0013A599D2|nr:alpha/beta hydrolase [Variovorax sp. PBL-E5]